MGGVSIMESIWLEYGWTLIILIGLEGILSADNALVLAVMAKHLQKDQRKKAINYGILMAFFFRFISIFLISFVAELWQVQAIGAAYLIYLSLKYVYSKLVSKKKENDEEQVKKTGSGFWLTVGKIGIADVAFAIDSVLAAFALAITLPNTTLPKIGGMDGGQFAVIVAGTIAGLVLIKFAAAWFIKLLDKRPGLETVAYLIVGWVGVKLAVITLAHPDVDVISVNFPQSTFWTITFWSVLIALAVGGWFLSGRNAKKT